MGTIDIVIRIMYFARMYTDIYIYIYDMRADLKKSKPRKAAKLAEWQHASGDEFGSAEWIRWHLGGKSYQLKGCQWIHAWASCEVKDFRAG